MAKKFFFLGFCMLLFSGHVCALQELATYVIASDGRGWWPYVCVSEKGASGICDCGRFMRDQNYTDLLSKNPSESLYNESDAMYNKTMECVKKCFYNFCGGRNCPFGSGVTSWVAAFGESCGAYPTGPFATDPYSTGVASEITILEDVKLVKPDGSVVGDELCLGDEFTVRNGASSGEYWWDGGFYDSPPIQWVDDVKSVFKTLLDYHEQTEFSDSTVYNSHSDVPDDRAGRFGANDVQAYLDPLTGLTVYSHSMAEPWAKMADVPQFNPKGKITGAMVCSIGPGQVNASDTLVKKGDGYQVISTGEVEFRVGYAIECMYYYYGRYNPEGNPNAPKAYKDKKYFTYKLPTLLYAIRPTGAVLYGRLFSGQNVLYNSKQDFFKVGEAVLYKKIRVHAPPNRSVEIAIIKQEMKIGEPNVLRVLVTNKGTIDIYIVNISSNAVHRFISCDAKTVAPGETKECLVSITPQTGEGVNVQVNYEYKFCGKDMLDKASIDIISSQTALASSLSQVYTLDVSGGCVNRYYDCNPAVSQDMFSLGYKCSRKESDYYVSSIERIDMGFVLPPLPKGATFAGARLRLKVSGTSKTQEVSLYSIPEWSQIECLPSGDICAKPYCSECRPLFEAPGQKLSAKSVAGPGTYFFDVSDAVKKAYYSGGRLLSFQLRGKEDYPQPESSLCGAGDDWKRYDLDFRGESDGPQLEIVYYK